MAKADTIEQLRAHLAAMRADPVLFVRRILGGNPSSQQLQILQAIAPSGAHVTVRAGTTTGKSTVMAWVVLWALSLYDDLKVPCTAPTGHQLYDVLWAEIAKWHQRMVPEFRARLSLCSDRVEAVLRPKANFAVARTSRRDQPEALQGFHAEHLLFIIDEASGIDDEVFEVAEGSLSTPGARVLMAGNPTRLGGYFHRSHTSDRAAWTALKLSTTDSPFAAPGYAKGIADRFGLDSNMYRVRVLGEFPKENPDQLILLEWIESAVGRDLQPYDKQPRVAGLDVARYGDDLSALVIRQGGRISHVEQWGGVDTMFTTGKVVDAYRNKKLFDVVKVDAIGIGSGVADRLAELQIPTVAVNVAEAPAMGEKFAQLRDELWWTCREWFRERKIAIDPKLSLKDDLIGELCGVTFEYLSTGKLKVESKDRLKARGVASPNLADALCLSFCEGYSPRGGALDRPVVQYRSEYAF